jgi:hypothetical protein
MDDLFGGMPPPKTESSLAEAEGENKCAETQLATQGRRGRWAP